MYYYVGALGERTITLPFGADKESPQWTMYTDTDHKERGRPTMWSTEGRALGERINIAALVGGGTAWQNGGLTEWGPK